MSFDYVDPIPVFIFTDWLMPGTIPMRFTYYFQHFFIKNVFHVVSERMSSITVAMWTYYPLQFNIFFHLVNEDMPPMYVVMLKVEFF